MPFTTTGLSDPLVRGILATGFTAPTEIQSQVIPAALKGQDIIGCAQTGTGKTAAFALPILNRISHEPPRKKRTIRALVLTPTRELAAQVEKAMLDYGRFLDLRTLAIYGGVNINGQFGALRHGVDVVVATPGRLMDHMERGTVDLRQIEVLVLDEADRMLDMGFIKDVRKIIATLPRRRQTLLFSATISPEVRTLAGDALKSPITIQIGRPRNPIESVTQHVHLVPRELKTDLLLHMLQNKPMYSVLVFTRTKHGADKINKRLTRAGLVSVSLHSGRSQNRRQSAMDGFKKGRYQVMVATDIAARGIDIEGISHVINFDVPAFAEDYIHRIGRTGRAAAKGDAITFVSPDERKHLHQIEEFIGRKLTPEPYDRFTHNASDIPHPRPADKPTGRQHTTARAPFKGRKASPSRRRRRKAPRR
ncbi:MAG: DEAD/DEAH box helicase [Sedimentisphaerales bacterium]|nr:DEAD/DEAH box helicase [Sedimentisphaerales bacterium]